MPVLSLKSMSWSMNAKHLTNDIFGIIVFKCDYFTGL